MRAFVVIVLLLVVGIGIGGLALGWFNFSTSPIDGKTDVTLTIDTNKIKKDRDSVFGAIGLSATDKKSDAAADVTKQKERDAYQQLAETRVKAMDVNLAELTAKAKSGRDVTKEKMNEAIDELTKKTAAAREELRQLNTAAPEQWEGLKHRLSDSLDDLENRFERTFSRFMNEST